MEEWPDKRNNYIFRQCWGLSTGNQTEFPSVLVCLENHGLKALNMKACCGSVALWLCDSVTLLWPFWKGLPGPCLCRHWPSVACSPFCQQHSAECCELQHKHITNTPVTSSAYYPAGSILSILHTLTHLVSQPYKVIVVSTVIITFILQKKKMKQVKYPMTSKWWSQVYNPSSLTQICPFSLMKTARHLCSCCTSIFWSPTHGASHRGWGESIEKSESATMELMFLVRGNRQ